MIIFPQLPQPDVIRAQYGNEDISLPAIGATFETTLPLKQRAQNSVATKETENSFNINMYLDEDVKVKEKSAKPQSTINFSVCKLKDNRSTCELAKHISEPTAKRRKINILPSGVDAYFSAPSTSSSTVLESHSVNIAPNIKEIKEANKDDKKALGKQYLKDVSI